MKKIDFSKYLIESENKENLPNEISFVQRNINGKIVQDVWLPKKKKFLLEDLKDIDFFYKSGYDYIIIKKTDDIKINKKVGSNYVIEDCLMFSNYLEKTVGFFINSITEKYIIYTIKYKFLRENKIYFKRFFDPIDDDFYSNRGILFSANICDDNLNPLFENFEYNNFDVDEIDDDGWFDALKGPDLNERICNIVNLNGEKKFKEDVFYIIKNDYNGDIITIRKISNDYFKYIVYSKDYKKKIESELYTDLNCFYKLIEGNDYSSYIYGFGGGQHCIFYNEDGEIIAKTNRGYSYDDIFYNSYKKYLVIYSDSLHYINIIGSKGELVSKEYFKIIKKYDDAHICLIQDKNGIYKFFNGDENLIVDNISALEYKDANLNYITDYFDRKYDILFLLKENGNKNIVVISDDTDNPIYELFDDDVNTIKRKPIDDYKMVYVIKDDEKYFLWGDFSDDELKIKLIKADDAFNIKLNGEVIFGFVFDEYKLKLIEGGTDEFIPNDDEYFEGIDGWYENYLVLSKDDKFVILDIKEKDYVFKYRDKWLDWEPYLFDSVEIKKHGDEIIFDVVYDGKNYKLKENDDFEEILFVE